MIKELVKTAIKDLIVVYHSYVSEGATKRVQALAKEVYEEYMPGRALLPEEIHQSIGKLIDIYAETGVEPPTREEAQRILEDIQKLLN